SLGGVVGVVLAAAALPLVKDWVQGQGITLWSEIRLDTPVLAFSLGLSLMADGDLLASRNRPRQQQIGGIGASDQQHQEHESLQEQDGCQSGQPPSRSLRNDLTTIPQPGSYTFSCCRAITDMAAWPCAMDTPGFRRARASKLCQWPRS